MKKFVLYNLIYFFLFILLLEITLNLVKLKNIHFVGNFLSYGDNNVDILKPSKTFKHTYNNYEAIYIHEKYSNRISSRDNLISKDKILLLGDSWTFGWLLNEEYIINNELSKRYPNYYFINSSTPGHGLSDNLQFLKSYCKKIKPKKVILIMNYSHIERSVSNKFFEINKGKFIQEKKDVSALRKFLRENEVYGFLINNFKFMQLIRSIVYHYSINNSKKNTNNNIMKKVNYDNSTEIGNLIVEEIVEEINRCNSKIIFVYNGWYASYDEKNYSNLTIKFIKNSNIFREKNLIFEDASEDLKEVHSNMKKYQISEYGDIHPNNEGAKIKNLAIINKLEKHL